jgi:hypothetical protein
MKKKMTGRGGEKEPRMPGFSALFLIPSLSLPLRTQDRRIES